MAMPKPVASCWLMASRLLPALFWSGRRSAMARVFIAVNCSELPKPVIKSSTTHTQAGVAGGGRATAIIIRPSSCVLVMVMRR